MTREGAAKLFKCLSDTSRLRIVRSLAREDMYTELLAERMGLTPSTVSFHMKKLEEAGLVTSRKEQYYTVYSLEKGALSQTLGEIVIDRAEQPDEEREREEEYRRKVVRAFFECGKLRSIPVQRKKKLICYAVIAEAFEIGREYPEKEANAVISAFHDDYCTIRRDMIGEGILKREGGTYVRLK